MPGQGKKTSKNSPKKSASLESIPSTSFESSSDLSDIVCECRTLVTLKEHNKLEEKNKNLRRTLQQLSFKMILLIFFW